MSDRFAFVIRVRYTRIVLESNETLTTIDVQILMIGPTELTEHLRKTRNSHSFAGFADMLTIC